MGIFQAQKEVLVAADHDHPARVWRPDCSHERIGHCTFYLHAFLSITSGILSWDVIGQSDPGQEYETGNIGHIGVLP